MKHTILVFSTIVLATTAEASPRALREHVDIHWTYDEVDGWTCVAKTIEEGEDLFEELEDVYLPIDDAPTGSGGLRDIQPEDEIFSFTGVAPGDPIWIASQDQSPNLCWPGFNNYQASGVFGSYQETDLRLSDADRAIVQPWIKVTLEGVDYQGSGTGAFCLWFEDRNSGEVTVWMSTTDNTHPDTYLFRAGDHKHVNWGFGSPGIYRIRLSASAYLGPGNTIPSDTFTITFAVGAFAEWQATDFSGVELENPLISGPDADPDKDGMKNTVEFAFGYDPKKGAAVPVATGLGLPKLSLIAESGTFYEVLEYPQRRAGEQLAPLVYTPRFSSTLNSESWSQTGVDTTSADFPAPLNSLNTVWENVTSKRAVGPAAPPRGFGRVTLGPGSQ